MPIFNAAFLNPKNRASSGGGGGGLTSNMLTDQLTILKSELMRDGFLSQGDYELLLQTARTLSNNPTLTENQRSDWAVRISGLETEKANTYQTVGDDITRMNDSLSGEAAEDVMMAGNNPEEFLTGRLSSLRAKLDDLMETIERKESAGQDYSSFLNEYQDTLQSYQDKSETLNAITGWQGSNAENPSAEPVFGYVAYVKTNSNGEITDVDYNRYDGRSGYSETNAMLGGLQVYGKVNYKQNGNNFFAMGNELFSGVDQIISDPTNPGAFTTPRLVAQSFVKNPDSPLKSAQGGYKQFLPGEVSTQSYIPRNSWAKGINGTIYQRREDGGYTKYMNVNQSIEGRPDPQDMLTLPPSMEQNLMTLSDQTIDESAPMVPPTSEGFIGPLTQEQSQAKEQQRQSSGIPTTQQERPSRSMSGGPQLNRTPQQSRESTGSGIGSIARKTIKSGVDFFKNAIT